MAWYLSSWKVSLTRITGIGESYYYYYYYYYYHHHHHHHHSDSRNTASITNLEEEEIMATPGNDVNASMPEQVKRSNS